MASTTIYNERKTPQQLAAQIRTQSTKPLPWEVKTDWRAALPGRWDTQDKVSSRLVYRLLVLNGTARSIWCGTYLPKTRWMKGHRTFCGVLLAQCALANGWTPEQTFWPLQVWRGQHGFDLVDVQLKDFLDKAMAATKEIRKQYQMVRNAKLQAKTSYQILALVELGETTPAEAARQLGLSRKTVKVCLHRLAQAGTVQKAGRGRYSTVTNEGIKGGQTLPTGTPTVTSEGKEQVDKPNQVKLIPSIPESVTVAVPDPQEQYLRQMIADGELDCGRSD